MGLLLLFDVVVSESFYTTRSLCACLRYIVDNKLGRLGVYLFEFAYVGRTLSYKKLFQGRNSLSFLFRIPRYGAVGFLLHIGYCMCALIDYSDISAARNKGFFFLTIDTDQKLLGVHICSTDFEIYIKMHTL